DSRTVRKALAAKHEFCFRHAIEAKNICHPAANGDHAINLLHQGAEATMACADEGRHAQSRERSSGKPAAPERFAKYLGRGGKCVANGRRPPVALQHGGGAAAHVELSVTRYAP